MKCPVCNINHRVEHKASRCESRINNEMIHYIILTQGMKGGMTEENLLQYPHINDLSHFRSIKQKKEEMKVFMEKFGGR